MRFLVLALILCSTLAQADQLRYIPTGKAALMELAQIIKNARREIDLTYYIFDPCAPSTKILIELMAQKATKENVRVRLLVDAYTHDAKLRTNFTALMKTKNIEVRYFNVRASINPDLTYRTHAKLLLVDGREYISGGRNIAQDYFSLGYDLNFIDRDVYVAGKSAVQAQQAFNYLWSSPLSVVAKNPLFKDVKKLAETCGKWDDETAALAKLVAKQSKAVISAHKIIRCDDVKFVLDDWRFPRFNKASGGTREDSRPRGESLERKFTTQAVTKFINNTSRILTVENWAYDPRGSVYTAFQNLREKQVPIFVMTNKISGVGGVMDYLSTSSSQRDNGGSQYMNAISSQGSINDRWENTPKSAYWMIHSKVFVSDDAHTAVTSFNLDSRSYRFNLETAVIARNCPEFANEVLQEFGKLNEFYEKDITCDKCQQKPSFSITDKIIAIIGGSYY